MSTEAVAKFNVTVNRKIFLHGDSQSVDAMRRLLKPFYFLAPRTGLDMPSTLDESHFIAYALDFENAKSMQHAARLFTAHDAPGAIKVIYALKPPALSQEQLLFAQEIGARFTAHGADRDGEFKDFLKRICVEAHHVGSLSHFEDEVELAAHRRDTKTLHALIEKLVELPQRGEEVLRLLVVACQGAGLYRKAEIYLRNILRLNPQNLWAANELGRQYLRSGRIAKGVEILRRLSLFHELNGERLLTLGTAYVDAGCGEEAQEFFQKGADLSGGEDERFRDGLAKARIVQGDGAGALALVEGRGFSDEVISFLNMRAIMAIREGDFDGGMKHYEQALRGSGDIKTVKAKLQFNMGLAYARHGKFDEAKLAFKESLRLGGQKFKRAEGPLTVIKNLQAKSTADDTADGTISDWEFETIY